MNIRRSMLAIMLTIVILTVCGAPAFAAGTAGAPEEAEESAGVVSSAEVNKKKNRAGECSGVCKERN